MQSPFFRSPYVVNPSSRAYDANGRSGRGIPVQRPPKVVSIPVYFVDSDISRSTAAERIQKVFRGFLVRRNMNKIAGIRKQVDEIEAKLSLQETVDLVQKDAKERLKVNETLMSLLLKLDSVRGVDSGVRDCRKAVIKKVIMLQERLDSIVSGNQEEQIEEIKDADDDDDPIEEIKYPIDPVEADKGQEHDDFEGEKKDCCNATEEEEEEEAAKAEIIETESVKESVDEKKEEEEEIERQGELIQEGKGDESKEVMKKMLEKNEMLIGMVRELCEKNKMQTEMINSLSRRVDGLEKAFKRSKCKKRKQAAGSDVNGANKF